MKNHLNTTHDFDDLDQLAYRMCHFLNQPFPECYCLNMSGMNIPKILEFCNGGFKLCPIYCLQTA